MSDVLTSAEPGSLLLTGLANAHVVCTCSVADLAGVVFVQGKRPAPEVVDQARSKNLPLIVTRMPMFEACGRIAGLVEDGGHAAAEEVFRQEFPVRGGDFAKAGAAACGIKELLKDLGIDSSTVRRAAIVSYEAEMNVIMYA